MASTKDATPLSKLRRSKRTTARKNILFDAGMGAGGSAVPKCELVATPCTENLHSLVLHVQSNAVVRCLTCPGTPLLCKTCLFPWRGEGQCPNKRCAVVGMLLTCGSVTDHKSKVNGCPEFRACPKCYSLIRHEGGCKYVMCPQCAHRFCYICLSDRGECNKNSELYWSLICSKPRAGRQWFCA